MSSPTSVTSNTNSSANTTTAKVYAQVNTIMQAQNKTVPLLNAALNADTTTLSGLGQLNSALATFQSVAQSLSGNGLNLSATSTSPSVLSATTSNQSVTGSYAIQVTQLAQSQVLQSAVQSSQTAAIGAGTASKITFNFGTVSGNTFSAKSSEKSVSLPSGTNSLQSIAAAINNANIGVTAKVVTSGAGYALDLQSPTGAASSMRIGVTGDSALQGLLSYDPAGVKNLTQTASAQNASLTVNGAAVSSVSNTITNVVPGTTLSLTATGNSNLIVAQGSAQILQNVTNLVNAYNALNSQLNTLRQATLKSEGSAASAQIQLERIFISPGGNGASGSPLVALAKMGITTQKSGTMIINTTTLQNAINADPMSVSKIFTNGGNGLADHLVNQIQGLIGPTGSISQYTTALNHDVTMLNARKSILQTAMTAQANALLNYYTQQNAQATSTSSTSSSAASNSGITSILSYLR